MAIYCPLVGSDVVYLNCNDCEYKGECKDGLISLNDEILKLGAYMDVHSIIAMIRNNYGVTLNANDRVSVLVILLDKLWNDKDNCKNYTLQKVRKQVFSLTNYFSR